MESLEMENIKGYKNKALEKLYEIDMVPRSIWEEMVRRTDIEELCLEGLKEEQFAISIININELLTSRMTKINVFNEALQPLLKQTSAGDMILEVFSKFVNECEEDLGGHISPAYVGEILFYYYILECNHFNSTNIIDKMMEHLFERFKIVTEGVLHLQEKCAELELRNNKRPLH